MRLFELIQTHFNKIDKEFTDADNKSMNDFDSSDMSVGTTAKVNQVDNDHVVKKSYHKPSNNLSNDAYYSYIKQIADNDLASSNPFFPRVYNVDIETDKSGKQKPIFDIEKLVPGEQIDNEVLYGLADTLFNNIDDLIVAYTKKGMKPTHANMNMQIGRILADIVGGGA